MISLSVWIASNFIVSVNGADDLVGRLQRLDPFVPFHRRALMDEAPPLLDSARDVARAIGKVVRDLREARDPFPPRSRGSWRSFKNTELARDLRGKPRVREGSAANHEMLAAGLIAAAPEVIERPDLAV